MQFSNESSATSSRWPPYRSYDVIIYDVIAGHWNVYNYVNNSSQNWARAVGEVSLCLSWYDASTDMQRDLPGSFITTGHLTWPKVKFSDWPIGVKMHMFLGVLTPGMRWCFAFFLTILSSKAICKNVSFIQKLTIFLSTTFQIFQNFLNFEHPWLQFGRYVHPQAIVENQLLLSLKLFAWQRSRYPDF